jgi:hypothetical protein
MSIDDYARWLSRVTLAVAIVMIGWGSSVVLSQPVTAWFAASATIWMALLLISALWQLRGSFIAIAALALATAVVSRLFSILRLNPSRPAGLCPMSYGRFWRASESAIRRFCLVPYRGNISCASPARGSQFKPCVGRGEQRRRYGQAKRAVCRLFEGSPGPALAIHEKSSHRYFGEP